ncbi:serine hydrolase domain-containing protein [Methylosinus sp. LW3]|uniref:serine hydrolase domain-containing protein n=1 Tax=Methylosinus sp. LW3 TaxID=107635 RepID=UPI000467A1AD|nr:serine hydrolase domain-containing protein [Methylosinus sp. LW3]
MFHAFNARTHAQTLSERLDLMLSRRFNPDEPGAAIIVTKNGEPLFRAAYGSADVEREIALDPGMTFRLGSLTKQFTAVAIMILAEQGKLSVQEDIREYLSDYPTHRRSITIEHLLTHTSGVKSYTDMPNFKDLMARDMSVDEMIDYFKNEPLQFEPGAKFAYSNSGYFLLGAIIEQISGGPYASFMAEKIFEPLCLRGTAYEGFERVSTPKAVGYSRKRRVAPISMTQPYAAGALVSTVDDLARWDAAISSGKLLSAESWRRVFAPFKLNNGRMTSYAYGWGLGPSRPLQMFEHGGGIPGFATHAIRVPDGKVYVAVLMNDDGGDPGLINFVRLLWSGRIPSALASRAMAITVLGNQAAGRA